ncbi:MAG: histidinol-phosphatase HisJ family protein [Bacteroidia bacterium]|nr:MAG: histidinol-phosphatase HisJ family protein [Bacteroidia bacterium]
MYRQGMPCLNTKQTMLYNFHTHSHYDDGKEPLEAYVVAAIEKGLSALGFSGHQPLPFDNEWSLHPSALPEYLAEARRLKEQYKNEINIYIGLEMDYIPGHSEDFAALMKDAGLDYCIGSVHLVMKPGSTNRDHIWFIDGPREGYFHGIQEIFNGNVRAAVEAYYEQQRQMVLTQKPHIIGHLDKVNMHNRGELFKTTEAWYQEAINHLLAAIQKTGTIVEANTRGVYTGKTTDVFPAVDILEKCHAHRIKVMVNTDAHHPQQLDQHFEETKTLLKRLGFSKTVTPFFESPL